MYVWIHIFHILIVYPCDVSHIAPRDIILPIFHPRDAIFFVLHQRDAIFPILHPSDTCIHIIPIGNAWIAWCIYAPSPFCRLYMQGCFRIFSWRVCMVVSTNIAMIRHPRKQASNLVGWNVVWRCWNIECSSDCIVIIVFSFYTLLFALFSWKNIMRYDLKLMVGVWMTLSFVSCLKHSDTCTMTF